MRPLSSSRVLQELDIQYTVGLATDVPVEYIMVGVEWQDGALEGYLDEVNTLLSMDSPPQVLTTSYGMSEDSLSFELTEYVPARSVVQGLLLTTSFAR